MHILKTMIKKKQQKCFKKKKKNIRQVPEQTVCMHRECYRRRLQKDEASWQRGLIRWRWPPQQGGGKEDAGVGISQLPNVVSSGHDVFHGSQNISPGPYNVIPLTVALRKT